ncbi:cupin domain-containing protein [Roseomonas sp. OT10]|uniref:cupin domain-containing protein n=1 Tax=Roseomonas cutis TaxID=2897332 RepID=UPI001E5E5B71|nr:cupin domain-containing protein [Roseomonas sp. OT10]UFN47563.1 cupin domain-containing protein [Roseomonas sp. OT10]
MANRQVSVEEMRARVALFRDMQPSRMPLIDAALPQYERQIYSIIGSGVTEDASVRPPIAPEGFNLSVVRCGPGKGTGLHNHTTVEVFVPLSGTWSVQWGDQGENELTIGQYDTISVPVGVMRGFRNDSDHEALLLVVLGGTDPGRVEWVQDVMDAARAKGYGFDAAGKITTTAPAAGGPA